MRIKDTIAVFAITFVVTLAAAIVVTFGYELITAGTGAVDWATSFRLAVTFAVVLPITRLFAAKARSRG